MIIITHWVLYYNFIAELTQGRVGGRYHTMVHSAEEGGRLSLHSFGEVTQGRVVDYYYTLGS